MAALRRPGRLLSHAVLWTALGILAGLVLAAAGPFVLGGRSFTVMSGSMEPAIHTGDLVVSEKISPAEAQVGDVVTFPDPTGADRLITHRLRSMQVRGGAARAVTKGDANNTVERWSAPADGHIGRVMYRLPRLGYVLAWGRSAGGRILLLLLPAVGLGIYVLIRIWREPEEAAGAA
jgi:signal peptidase